MPCTQLLIFEKPIGLKVGLESDYVINQNVKKMLRKNNQTKDDNKKSTDDNIGDEKEEETRDHANSNVE